ncbi:hypothetical protein Tco_0319356 [Tanacetum coccineum]
MLATAEYSGKTGRHFAESNALRGRFHLLSVSSENEVNNSGGQEARWRDRKRGGDLNGHIGAAADEYAGVHEGFGYGARNEEGRMILEGDLKACKDCMAFPSKACSSQHRLVTLDVLFERQRQRRAETRRTRILWKNLNGEAVETFRATVSQKLSTLGEDMPASDAGQMWNTLARCIKDVAKDSLGVFRESSKTHSTHRESWWFGEQVQTKIAVK